MIWVFRLDVFNVILIAFPYGNQVKYGATFCLMSAIWALRRKNIKCFCSSWWLISIAPLDTSTPTGETETTPKSAKTVPAPGRDGDNSPAEPGIKGQTFDSRRKITGEKHCWRRSYRWRHCSVQDVGLFLYTCLGQMRLPANFGKNFHCHRIRVK